MMLNLFNLGKGLTNKILNQRRILPNIKRHYSENPRMSDFVRRHIGPSLTEEKQMLKTINCSSFVKLIRLYFNSYKFEI